MRIMLFLAVLGAAAQASASSDGLSAVIGEGPVGNDNGQRFDCTGPRTAPGAVLCVRAGAATGGSGTASAPYAAIGAAIAAAKAGDIVQVAAGSYRENVALGGYASPTSRHLALLGGFSADFTQRNAAVHRATIDGGGVAPAVQLHLQGSATTTLDGFAITNGVGLGSTFADGAGHGGGVYAVQAGSGTIVISHNEIHGNRTRSHTTIDSRGGGIHAATDATTGAGTIRIEDNRVRNNLAGKGAGINVRGRQAAVLRNLVRDNTAHNDHGGGVYLSAGNVLVRGNEIRGNVVGATVGYGWGGGLIVAAGGATLERNLITDNAAPTAGAGVFWDEGATGTMRNDLLVRNRCPTGSRSAAALYVDGGPGGPSNVTVENATIADHVCPGTPQGAAVVVEDGSVLAVRNTILWGNTREFATLSGGSFSVRYSISGQPGTGNRNTNPLFVDAAGGDYHERSTGGHYSAAGWVPDAVTSPAVDAGDPATSASMETQPNGGRVNLGAFGNTAEASRSFDPALHILFDGFE